MISEKNDVSLNLSGNGNQVEAQGAFGLTERIAIQANGGNVIPSDLDNGDGGSGRFLELGGGYFYLSRRNGSLKLMASLVLGILKIIFRRR